VPLNEGSLQTIIKSALKRFGLEIRRTGFDRDLMDFIAHRQIDTVIDVGANIGQFGQELRAKGYRGKIVSFEPIASVYQALTATTTTDAKWESHNCALGVETGEATINVSQASVFSSILPSTQAATRFDKTAAIAKTGRYNAVTC
jgi:hypothetical protein